VPTVARADALKQQLPPAMTLPEMALRFILSNNDVSTVIPGMRQPAHVQANLAASDAGPLPPDLLGLLRAHRWNRRPASWTQTAWSRVRDWFRHVSG
jgi:aryl-alcohol dehydrogenase-like predicted oxidoreductase